MRTAPVVIFHKIVTDTMGSIIPISKVNSDRMVYFVNELRGEDVYWQYKVREGSGLKHWVLIPRMHYELTHKKRDDSFRRLCWEVRSYYRNTLVFNWTP